MTLFDESMESGTMFLSQANFLSFNSAMGSFGSSVSGLLSGVMSIVAMLPHLEMLKPILEEKSETSEAKLPAGELSGNIDIYDVSFRYNPELPLVLKNISFNIKAGSFVAVVGSSGSGKSTLLRILLGMETAEKGVIQYDGLDLSQLDVTSVRRQIGVVMQQGKLMSGSIFNNIVGSLPLTQDDAWEAARLVGLDKDIRDMPMGLHTVISEGGGNISGGQKQRILIARAIANRPRIVVFDEATSALDNATQAIVSETLERMKATRVIIAHRLSTIRKADKIIVIDKGRIAESGGYDELIEKGGIFKTLVERQTL
jgi:ATP-binding cassette subfamily C protein